jgi:glycosyltransferase involved in cell wall biosynthesis
VSGDQRSAGTAAPRVSVIMPVFDAGRDLEQAVRSVAAQTWSDRELVIVDDGSRDPTTLALLDAIAREPGVTVHRTPNRGPSRARNFAIERARGSYLLPLDADDWLEPTFLEKTVPLLDADPAVGVVHTWVGFAGEHHGVWRTGPFTLPELLSNCTIHVTSLFRREIWEQAGGFDPIFVDSSEDWDLWLSAAAHGWRGQCVPEVLTWYRRSPRSRERTARRPGVPYKRMRDMVAKHRPLYERHLEDAVAGLYEELMQCSATLERIYHHPVVRLGLAARGLLGRRKPRA